MADELPYFDDVNGNTRNGDESSINQGHNDTIEPIERKRQRMNHDGNSSKMENQAQAHESRPTEMIEPRQTSSSILQNFECIGQLQSCETPISLHSSEIYTKQHENESIIKTQTFWNTDYKEDDMGAIFLHASSMLQRRPPTTKLGPSTSKGFSVSEMLQPEMEAMSISLLESTIKCPLCQLYFPPCEVEIHASSCMEQ